MKAELSNQRVKFILEDMFKCFSHAKSGMADSWVLRLVDAKFSEDQIKEAAKYCINSFQKCPSYADFKNVILNNSGEGDERQKAENKFQKQYEHEISEYKRKRAEIVKVVGHDGLSKFFNDFYLPKLYPALKAHSQALGIPLGTFERLAVADLYAARFDPRKALEIARNNNARR